MKKVSNLYEIQFERRLEDPQVGGLLKTICTLEKVLVMNSGQFARFYNEFNEEELSIDTTLEEINELKMEQIRVIMLNICAYIKDHPHNFNEQEFNEYFNF